MSKFIFGALALAVTGALALPVSAQIAAARTMSTGTGTAPPRVRKPYTAEFKVTTVRTLGDGTTITHEWTETTARDSEGRLYNAANRNPTGDAGREEISVNINDPVAHTHTFWFSQGHRVTVTTNENQASSQTACSANPMAAITPQAGTEHEKPVTEELGKQTFLGVEAHGNRTTSTIPTGLIGNSAPITHTDEYWRSTEKGLNLTVRQVNDTPENGKTTRELIKFTPGDPDPSLFQPPADYEVVTQETHTEFHCPQ